MKQFHLVPSGALFPGAVSFLSAAPFLSVALLLTACSGSAVDLGHGPLGSAEPPSTPSARDVASCESGIDCHDGQCASCFLETCLCNSSDDISVLGCTGAGAVASAPVMSDDAQAVAFEVCLSPELCRAFYWSAATGRQEIRTETAGRAWPFGISGDGQHVLLITAAGDAEDATAWVYRPDGSLTVTGVQSPPLNAYYWHYPNPIRMSAGGAVIGATASPDGGHQLARWTEERGLELLAALSGSEEHNPIGLPEWVYFTDISATTPDGSTIVGRHSPEGGPDSGVSWTPFLWTDAGGLALAPGPLPETAQGALATAVSRDGSTLAGYIGNSEPREGGVADVNVFRWTQQEGFLELGPAGTQHGNDARVALSDDGSVVVAVLADGLPNGSGAALERASLPYRWTEQSGAEALANEPHYGFPTPFLSGDGVFVLGNRAPGDEYSLVASPGFETPEPPRRFEHGWVAALSRDGQVAAATGKCGGVDAVYRWNLSWGE
jgi:uncharacterized membrane protein